MRTLRTFIIIAILFVGGMAMSGCEDSNAASNDQQTTTNTSSEPKAEEKTMNSKEKKQLLDSINALVSQIEALSNSQETNTHKNNEVSKDVSDLKGSSHLYDLISWVVAAIALFVAIISLIRLSSIQKRANRHRKDIGEIAKKVDSLEQKINTVKKPSSGLSNSEYTSLPSRIYKIERQLEKMNLGSAYKPQNAVMSNPVSEIRRTTVNEQSGYFGLPTQMSLTEAYFKRLSDIRESDSRFTVEVRNDKAEFRPLEGTQYLNDLKSNDSIRMALDIQGCAPSEAIKMKVTLPGEAKKDGERWIITKKATITLI